MPGGPPPSAGTARRLAGWAGLGNSLVPRERQDK
jgi:hypothetical protein